MYLSLTLALGNMLAVVPPDMSSDRVPMEQSLDIVGDRSPNEPAGLSLKAQPELSNEFKIAQQPPIPRH